MRVLKRVQRESLDDRLGKSFLECIHQTVVELKGAFRSLKILLRKITLMTHRGYLPGMTEGCSTQKAWTTLAISRRVLLNVTGSYTHRLGSRQL